MFSRKNDVVSKVALGLGVFSVVLGALEVWKGSELSRGLGLKGWSRLVQSYGAREIAAGAGILASPALGLPLWPWIWARLAGDALDLATLGAALKGGNRKRKNAAIALALVAPVVALDVWCAKKLGRSG